MEQLNPARRSSGVYDASFGHVSQQSFNSEASLRAHAAAPAGGISTPVAVNTAMSPSSVEPKQPFYKKRWFIISQIISIPLAIALLFILLFPVVRAIVALVVKRTSLDIQAAVITQPVNGSFALHLEGNVFNTGIIPASIKFTEDTTVAWVEDDEKEIHLGFMRLGDLQAKHKRALIDVNTTFNIEDEDAFARFSAHLITAQNFTWRLVTRNLKVQAARFPVAKGITFDKTLTLNGFNNFNGNIILQDFQLPSDNPAGGINFVAVTQLFNPSPFSLDLGTIVFALSYRDVPLGLGVGNDTVIAPGNNSITLAGKLERQTDENDLVKVSELFTNYLNGVSSPVIATGLSTLQSDGSTISWLSSGLQSLALNVPFKSLVPIDPIRAITINDFGLQFTADQAWSPLANSRTIQASLQLPFGFGLSINEIQNDFTIVAKDGNSIAGLSTGIGASTSSISVLDSIHTSGYINITIVDTRLSCPDSQHDALSAFNVDLTNSEVAEFRLVGKSRAVANMSLGKITLDGINVNVSTTLNGLHGLKGSTTIDNVDVIGGSTSGIELDLQVTIVNPSNLDLALGDLTLQLARDGVVLGTNLLPNLTLLRGKNSVNASSIFDPNASPQGVETLNDFVSHKNVPLTISGYNGSTEIESLLSAFESLSIDVVLPALKTNLLNTANLQILPTTGIHDNISHVTVFLDNPFSVPLEVTQILSQVSVYGIALGTINQSTQFTSAPKSTTQSPTLDLDMNFDPAALFTLTRVQAAAAGLDIEPLDEIVSLVGIQYVANTYDPIASKRQIRRDNIFTRFDLPTFVQAAFKNLKSDVALTTDLIIGEYPTTLKFSQTSLPTQTDKSIDYILPVIAAPIVQKVVAGSVLGLDTVLIINPGLNSFKTHLKGSITNSGPFDATISFPSGLTISWQGNPIGQVSIGDINIKGDIGGTIDAETIFQVADVNYLTDFTKTLLASESFDWEISGENLTVRALGISVPGITFASRTVTLKGFNGLTGGVIIDSFDLPSNDPAGGIHLTIDTTVVNPSQVGIELSSLGFNTFAGGSIIAPVASKSTVALAPLASSQLSLIGRLIPQDSAAGLSAVSTIFNNFIQGKDSGVVVHGASAGAADVTWLNQGIQALQVSTILPNRGKLDIIKSINLNELTLLFSTDAAYAPVTSSKATDAAFTLPFAFPLDISALEQTITLGYDGFDFGQLAIPKGPSTTDVDARVIHITFDNVPLAIASSGHPTFNKFVAATTVGSKQTVRLSGFANADAKTAVGLLSLTNIDFSVDSDISGLQGLNARPVAISRLDVKHGYPDYLLINVDGILYNPSNLTIGTGDVSFALQFQDKVIGSADLSDLMIRPGNGNYSIGVHFSPRDEALSAGRALLEGFIEGANLDTTISGSMSSTLIESLKSALSQIHLSPVTIPGLGENLIQKASLLFPTNIVSTGIASTSFTLVNPFTANINLLRLAATASFHGLTLGTIPNIDALAHPIVAPGHGYVTSPPLPLKFNLDPSAIIQLLLYTSKANGVSLGPLVDLFNFILAHPSFKPPVSTTVDSQAPICVSGSQFDAAGAILKSLTGLLVDLNVDTTVKLDDFATELAFSQKNVPALTDRTALFLIGAVAGPVAQHLVDASELAFTTADITNISNDGFDLDLQGSLTNIGPLDALITFMEPVTVAWQGQNIATITLPPICASANTGVPNYSTTAKLMITDDAAFSEFAIFLLHNPSFDWTISTSKLRVTALGTIFDNVSLSKQLTFKAFNGLPGVTVSNFKLPSDDPNGGIHIETDANIPSESQIGIDLGTVNFLSYFSGTLIGPLSTSGLVLKASSLATTRLSGRILPQNGADLDNIGKLFSNFLKGENITLQTTGDTVQPTGSSGTVKWLTAAFKTLTIDVILPGQKLNVIKEIELNDLAVTIKTPAQTFAPPTASHDTIARYANPFGFSLAVVEVGQTIVLGSQGVKIAQLSIPSTSVSGGVSAGNLVDLTIAFTDIPLQALDPTAFVTLFAGVTLRPQLEVDITGAANVVARTSIGDVPIAGIPIDVQSELKGIASFGQTAQLNDVSIQGSGGSDGSEYIVTRLKTTLQNPSEISLDTIEVALPVFYKGVSIGRASLPNFDLVPGENAIDTEFHYQPADANDTLAQEFLTSFIQTGDAIGLSIIGDADSTPFTSLKGALANLRLSTSIQGLNQPDFIKHVHVTITLDSLDTNLVSADFDVHNPLDTEITLEFVQSDASIRGTTYAQFSQPFSGFTVQPGETANSGVFDNVYLTQGAYNSLDIIADGYLDIRAAATIRVGPNGYGIPWLKLNQDGVPTSYDLSLGFAAAKKAAAPAFNSTTHTATGTLSMTGPTNIAPDAVDTASPPKSDLSSDSSIPSASSTDTPKSVVPDSTGSGTTVTSI
ncbi:hypothetical protein BDN70DRAFT_122528 [Pholiota conissans]|uniref:Uncharacterized protein n=1 Tax=Pholiota conissans TaxID=109636 RepID=A0A9P5ZBM2_9AGAR|nr:hypothetical protein BDN70DRAFT_122528 [Pholiota conissans]